MNKAVVLIFEDMVTENGLDPEFIYYAELLRERNFKIIIYTTNENLREVAKVLHGNLMEFDEITCDKKWLPAPYGYETN